MKKIIDVSIGEVKSGSDQLILTSSGIGSCIAVVAYDCSKRNGVLAHVMLPGKSEETGPQKTKYACDAIDELLRQLVYLGTTEGSIEVCLVGGGNVLKENDCTICRDNLFSIENELFKKDIPIRAQAVGGTKRRTATLDIGKGVVFYTEGDSDEKILWKAEFKTKSK